jgi:hypothetical protein
MTNHVRLHSQPATERKRRVIARIAPAMRGVEQITLFPESPTIRLGSLSDDWRAIGGDIRSAMRKFEKA